MTNYFSNNKVANEWNTLSHQLFVPSHYKALKHLAHDNSIILCHYLNSYLLEGGASEANNLLPSYSLQFFSIQLASWAFHHPAQLNCLLRHPSKKCIIKNAKIIRKTWLNIEVWLFAFFFVLLFSSFCGFCLHNWAWNLRRLHGIPACTMGLWMLWNMEGACPASFPWIWE